ncbi:hypothetical protein Barb6_01728 [Bacteroidales bacterium Barb6]|nr:hypothetical protein Barb6_01728 [Bacteroidales bacterium Barb6]
MKKTTRTVNGRGDGKEKAAFYCEDLRRLMRIIKREVEQTGGVMNKSVGIGQFLKKKFQKMEFDGK